MLERAGIRPDFVCGTSIGALVAAAYAAGALDRLEPWVRQLSWKAVLGLLDVRMDGGLIEGAKLVSFFRSYWGDTDIARLERPFSCVATELHSGREIWLREGPVIDAVRASIALPGLFAPVAREGRLLVDGGLVNPVPVSLCRAMGADIVIAVDLNWALMRRHMRIAGQGEDAAPRSGRLAMLETLLARFRPPPAAADEMAGVEQPSMLDVLSASLNIMQMRITQSRLAGEPADVMIRPLLHDMAPMDYHLGAQAIAEGERATEYAMPQILDALGQTPTSAAAVNGSVQGKAPKTPL